MAFPTANRTLAVALGQAQDRARWVRDHAVTSRNAMAAGPVTASFALALLDNLIAARVTLQTAASRAGIAAYASEQLGKDVTNDFADMAGAIDTLVSTLIMALPKNADGYLLMERIDATGKRTERVFSSTDTAGIRNLLDALIATIE